MSDPTCDICGTEQRHLQRLVPDYATDDIKELCDACMSDCSKHHDQVRRLAFKMTHTFMQRFFVQLRGSKAHTTGVREGQDET